MCGLVALPERRTLPERHSGAPPSWRQILRGCASSDARLAAAVAFMLCLVVAALHLGTT
jgi:hypothetical protein